MTTFHPPTWLEAIDPAVKTVLLDMGNVLVNDWWETMFFAEGGLAETLKLDRERLEEAGNALWSHYANSVRTEDEYWDHLEALLGRAIPTEVRLQCDALVLANPHAAEILDTLHSKGLVVGVISNNTAFWFPKQDGLVNITAYANPDLMFLSHTHGREKGAEPSLFEDALAACDPKSTLVVDDRMSNVDRAKRHGFHAVHYSMV